MQCHDTSLVLPFVAMSSKGEGLEPHYEFSMQLPGVLIWLLLLPTPYTL